MAFAQKKKIRKQLVKMPNGPQKLATLPSFLNSNHFEAQMLAFDGMADREKLRKLFTAKIFIQFFYKMELDYDNIMQHIYTIRSMISYQPLE